MVKNYKTLLLIFFSILVTFFIAQPLVVLATSVDHLNLCNLQGNPGEIVQINITLTGTEIEERTGYWYNFYKKVDGDDNKMDITSWITIQPEQYSLKQGDNKVFTVKVSIPNDAQAGLWGATSVEADQSGHSDQRRTYVVFKDTPTGGNVYSGLLIPVSVNVTENPSLFVQLTKLISENLMITVLLVVILILAFLLFLKSRPRKTA